MSSLLSQERRLPQTGEIVHLRQRLYLIDDVIPSGAGGATVVRGSCIDDDAQGQEIEALWELELDAEIRTAESWDKLAERGFDPPEQFAAYLNTMRWNCVTSTDARLLQAPFRAGIKLEPYQLEPLRKALRLPRVNLFIADDVGLGKRIEAGLIARELLLRKKVREIVVSCPPSMLLQWQEELQNRFGLRFEILNKDYIKNVRRERGFSVNPWTTHTRFLISHRLLIDEVYTSGLRDWLGQFKPGSLLILDEAHHAAPASGQKLAIDSDITKAVRDLAGRFEHRLFLSATPHNGHSNSFSALLAMLDPQRFTRGIPVTKQNRDEVMVRRIKEDLRVIQGGFPKRKVEQITLDDAAEVAELELFRLLSHYQEMREARLGNNKASRLVICHLQQRLFSSIDAFARTLKVHRRSVAKRQATLNEALLFRGVDADDERAALDDEEIERERDAQIEAATALAPIEASEDELLDRMTVLAERSRHAADARVRWLFDWLKTNLCPHGEWNDTRVIIFTEFEDTLHYLKRQLSGELPEAESRIETFSGATSRREEIKAAFNTEPAKHPVRILLATYAAREGLNLQAYCHNLFHFDVPWNPSRMEQRNGRIDRKLQPAAEVYCYYFVYANRPEDKILLTIVRKMETIRKELGSLSTVIDSQLERLLKGGIRRSQIEETAREIGDADLEAEKRRAIDDELETARQLNLRESIDGLRTLMDRSKKEVGLDEGHFRSAISCALEMMGEEPLRELAGRRYALPKLDEKDRSWASTMDSLRPPKEREQKLYEWRNSSPIRPVVFEDPGKVTDEVVQFHLEQQVVQRLLSRFLAQGFQLDDLSRACLAQTRDAIPRVVLLGRLALYGPGAARLHEEIVPVTARWVDPAIRKGPLQPYGTKAEDTTLDLLDRALLAGGSPNITIRTQLLRSAARDVEELLPHLHARAAEHEADARRKLAERGESEARQMLKILEEQQRQIEITKRTGAQQTFDSRRTGAAGSDASWSCRKKCETNPTAFARSIKFEHNALSRLDLCICGRRRISQWLRNFAKRTHLEWLGYTQPVGVVVSATALVEAGVALPTNLIELSQEFEKTNPSFRDVAVNFLGWRESDLQTAPESMTTAVAGYDDVMYPTCVVPDLLLIQELTEEKKAGELDSEIRNEATNRWKASPQMRFERLLRESNVPIGVLVCAGAIRLVYASKGESSGHITFVTDDFRKNEAKLAARPMLGALYMLLGQERLFIGPEEQRLPALLKKSRTHQNAVSTKLATQVMEALFELLRGFQPFLLEARKTGSQSPFALGNEPNVYEGLLTVLLRLVFVLYAEDRDLLSSDPLYVNNYSVNGLYEALREDEGRHPETMDSRYGAWARLLVLFRFIYKGARHDRFRLPGRKG